MLVKQPNDAHYQFPTTHLFSNCSINSGAIQLQRLWTKSCWRCISKWRKDKSVFKPLLGDCLWSQHRHNRCQYTLPPTWVPTNWYIAIESSLEECTSNLRLCLSVLSECVVTILTVRVIFSWSMTSTAQHQLQTLQNVVFNTSLILIYVDTGVLQEFSVKVLDSTQLSVLLLQYDYTYMNIETIHTLLM